MIDSYVTVRTYSSQIVFIRRGTLGAYFFALQRPGLKDALEVVLDSTYCKVFSLNLELNFKSTDTILAGMVWLLKTFR